MKNLRTVLMLSLIGLSAGLVIAQPAGAPAAAGSAASAPRMGPGMGPGMGPASRPGMGPGARGMRRAGSDVTPGWALMSPQERTEHRQRMRDAKTYDECKAVQQQHHEQMVARAKERGGQPLAQPRRDACAGLKP